MVFSKLFFGIHWWWIDGWGLWNPSVFSCPIRGRQCQVCCPGDVQETGLTRSQIPSSFFFLFFFYSHTVEDPLKVASKPMVIKIANAKEDYFSLIYCKYL